MFTKTLLELLHHFGVQKGPLEAGECLDFRTGVTKETDAILGLDFGTACTKAVIRLPFVPGAPAFAIPLAAGTGNPFLLQSNLPKGGGAAGPEAQSPGPRPNLKVRLLVNPEDADAQALTAAYLSRVMRRARCWFLTSQKKNYGKFRPRWSINIGVPSSGYEDERIQQSFLACARAAWSLSLDPETPSDQDARAELNRHGSDGDLPVDRIPEIAASAEGYRRSLFAHDGMHVMMDIGASTLDICGFMLKGGPGDKPFGLFATVVEHLGAAVLHDDRVRALDGFPHLGQTAYSDARNPTFAVPDGLRGYVSPPHPIPKDLSLVDSKFQEQCALALRTVLGGLYRKNRYARWRDGTPLFLAGGGGSMRFYRKIVEDIPVKTKNCAWSNVRVEDLVVPDDLRPTNLGKEVMARLLVAYGLSFPRPDFGTFLNPGTIPDMDERPPRRRLDDRYVGKEQV